MLDMISHDESHLLSVRSRVRVNSDSGFGTPQSLEIVVAPYDDFRSLSFEVIDRVRACAIGNENGTFDTKFIGNAGNSDPCISPGCCYRVKVVSVRRSTSSDEERYPPMLERLRRLEVLEPAEISTWIWLRHK